ncbi:MAG TPA: DUF4129 domain-containing protein [Salinimicrobium sp.]|nr:DUF4129 domain-containing protein [Salinimicrobium sp.]
MRNLILLVFLFCFSWTSFAVPQEDSIADSKEIIYDELKRNPIDFNDSYLEELKQQDEFIYVEQDHGENWWSIFKNWISNLWNSFLDWLFGDINASGFWATLLQLLPYLVIIGVFIFIVWLFIKLNPGKSLMGTPIQGQAFLSDDEKIIQSENIESLIEKAKENKDYRLAVRYYFLLILKNFIDKNIIQYQMEKTNEDYISEINNLQWQNEFKSLAHVYDFTWYGNFLIQENGFFKVEKQFQNLNAQLKSDTDG